MVRIEPLSTHTLEDTKNLLYEVFGEFSETETPDISLKASLNPDIYRQVLDQWDIPKLRYWVALDDNQKVVGTVGLYEYGKDHEAVWLGWYGVLPEARGKGIGSGLLTFALQKAKEKGRNYLRLYTSTDPNEAVAVGIYERRGFRKIGEESLEGIQFKTLFYQLDLGSA